MCVRPVPSTLDVHQPWSSDRIAALSDRGVLGRAAALLALPAGQLPLPLH